MSDRPHPSSGTSSHEPEGDATPQKPEHPPVDEAAIAQRAEDEAAALGDFA